MIRSTEEHMKRARTHLVTSVEAVMIATLLVAIAMCAFVLSHARSPGPIGDIVR
jgi:hypothetical protein